MPQPDPFVAVIPRDPPEKYPDSHGDPHRNKAHCQRDPRSLKHPGKDVSSQIIGPEKIDAEPWHLLGSKGLQVGL